MMNQREALPEKALVKETKYKIVRQNESALLQKLKNIHEKLAEQTRRAIAEAEGERCI